MRGVSNNPKKLNTHTILSHICTCVHFSRGKVKVGLGCSKKWSLCTFPRSVPIFLYTARFSSFLALYQATAMAWERERESNRRTTDHKKMGTE